jgi:hypothetical protein
LANFKSMGSCIHIRFQMWFDLDILAFKLSLAIEILDFLGLATVLATFSKVGHFFNILVTLA